MGHSDGGAIFASPGSDALIPCEKIRVFHFAGRFRALGQHRLEGLIALVRPAMLPLHKYFSFVFQHFSEMPYKKAKTGNPCIPTVEA